MQEQTRLNYLQAMGITQWMPRDPLPHAPAPRWLPQQAANHHSHAEVDAVAEAHHMPTAMAAEWLMLDDAFAGKPQAEAGATINSVPTSGDRTAEISAVDLTPPRFELHFLRIGQHGLWVCSDVQQLDAMMRFAYRVMMGMKQTVDIMPAPTPFRWPYIESNHQDQSHAVAQRALAAQWQFFVDQDVQYLIAMGESANEWLPACGAEPVFSANRMDVLLQSPEEKRRLWHTLLAQIKRLPDGRL